MNTSALVLVSVSILGTALPPLVIDWWRHRHVRAGWVSNEDRDRWLAWWDDDDRHRLWRTWSEDHPDTA